MATFYVNDWNKDLAPTPGNVLDSLIDTAGGKPLPGKWGLAQAILGCLAQPRHNVHPALHWPKIGLNVAGIVRAYRKANDPSATEERHDPIGDYVKTKNLAIPDGLERLAGLILSYAAKVPHEDLTVGEGADDWLRVYTLPTGLTFTFRMWRGSGYASGRDMGHGPYVCRGDHASFLGTINEIVWSAEGGADLQLTATRQTYGPPVFSLNNIGEPDDYVGNGAARSTESVARRCRAFRDRGVSRNILFYGPPGTGKTTLARSVARGLGAGRTLRVEADALSEAGVGATIGFLRVLRPRVVLFDDMDRCMDNVVDLLHVFEQGSSIERLDAILIGTINVVSRVDPALLRPGRFDEVIEIAEPDVAHRAKIVAHYLSKHGLSADLHERIMLGTDGFAPADVREVVQCVAAVGDEHLDAEMERVRRQRALFAGDACETHARLTMVSRGAEALKSPR